MEDNAFIEAVLQQLRAEMAARDISGAKAAEQAGVAYSVLVRYLRGERALPLVTLYRILEILDVPVTTFMARVEERAR